MGNGANYERLPNPLVINEKSKNIGSKSIILTESVNLGPDEKDIVKSMDDFITSLNKINSTTNLSIESRQSHLEYIRDLVVYYKSNPSDIPIWYNQEKLLDWYEQNLNLIILGDNIAEILVDMMPENKRTFLWKLYSNMTPIPILKLAITKINPDILNDKKETFLFQVPSNPSSKYLDKLNYIINVITEIDSLPLNHLSNHGNSFAMKIFTNTWFWNEISTDIQWKFLNLLSKREFTFELSHSSILSHMLMHYPDNKFYYYNFVRCQSWNPAKDPEWLQSLLLNDFPVNCYNYIWALFKRKDYNSFLYRVYTSNHINWVRHQRCPTWAN